MKYRFEKARNSRNLKANYVAECLNVTPGGITHWENGTRSPNLEKLSQLADLYGVTTDYLLGRNDREQVALTGEIPREQLKILHDSPIWLTGFGWGLVNVVEEQIVFANGTTLSFSNIAGAIYAYPPAFVTGLRGIGDSIELYDLSNYKRVWVEPISTDKALRDELKGWYAPHENRMVRNELGQSFYFDTYGNKWLAFGNCLDSI